MKNNIVICLVLVLSLFLSETSVAQNVRVVSTPVQVTQAEKIGRVPPVRTLVPVASLTEERRKLLKSRRKAPKNFVGRGRFESMVETAQPKGQDPIRQLRVNQQRTAGDVIEPLVNVEGIATASNPNDPSGDVGTNHYLQAVNATQLGVFDKEGNLLNTFTANTLWSTIGYSSAGDPIILFDQEANKWVITEFPSSNNLLVAVSDDDDPLGGYTAYHFATPDFPDYPKYGIWNNAYVVTTNEEGNSTSTVYLLDRTALLNGAETVTIQRTSLQGSPGGPGFQVDTPVDWTGLTPPPAGANPMVLSMEDDAWGATDVDKIDIYSFNVDFENPDNTVISVQALEVSPFDSNPCSVSGSGYQCIPQKDGDGLDGIPETIMNQIHYRNFGSYEAMVLNYSVDATAGDNLSGIRWMELRREVGATEWTVYQEGTFAPEDGLDRFMGGISMDGNGNIALAYNVSSEDIYVGVRFTGRRSSDPLGEMTVPEYNAVDGSSTLNTGGRFGDYAHMSIDPTDDKTFWYTTQYAGQGGYIATRVIAYDLGKDTLDLKPVALLTPQTDTSLTATEVVKVQVRNTGLDTVDAYTLGYIFEGQPEVTVEIDTPLYPDSVYTHTFEETVDLSAYGDYTFKVFTHFDEDQAVLNDTLTQMVRHLYKRDLGVMEVYSSAEGVLCTAGESVTMNALIANYGGEVLTTGLLEVSQNGSPLDTVEWTGNLTITADTVITFPLSGLSNGINNVTVTSIEINGQTDENTQNDSNSASINFDGSRAPYRLELTTDEYPAETSWTLSDVDGNLVYSGSEYTQELTLHTESFCLDTTLCYVFEIVDAYGDGICCQYGNGSYTLYNSDNNAIASGSDFGSSDVTAFCIGGEFDCNLTASVNYTNEEVENGATIYVEGEGGLLPYEYSIDGGVSFRENNLFLYLSAGDYQVVVKDRADCRDTILVTVLDCVIDVVGEVTNASAGNSDGSVSLSVTGGTAPYTYSIDNGATYQGESVFNNLAVGSYTILVKDANDCEGNIGVEVSTVSSTETVIVGQSFEILPNPNNGVFRINVKGLERSSALLPIEIYDVNGKLLYDTFLGRYDGVYTGMVTIYDYPDGVYFVKLKDKNVNRLLRVVKQ